MDPADIRIKFMREGLGEILKRGTEYFAFSSQKFIIGDAVDFTFEDNEVLPRGEITFTGNRNAIKIKFLDDGASVRVSFIISEDFDDIDIGNVMVYTIGSDGVAVPFVTIVFPEIIRKQNSEPEELNPNFKYPGNRLIIGLTLRYVTEAEINTTYTINIVAPNFANLPYFDNEENVPDGGVNPYSQFIINEFKGVAGNPAFVTKDSEDDYYSTPLWQNIQSPKYSILDGGATSQRVEWVWGKYLITPEGSYDGVWGAMPLLAPSTDVLVVGGSPLI